MTEYREAAPNLDGRVRGVSDADTTSVQKAGRLGKNYWLSDNSESTKFFGDIFSYTFDDTGDVRTPRSVNNCGNASDGIRNNSSASYYGCSPNFDGSIGSSWHSEMAIDFNQPESTPIIPPSLFDNNPNAVISTLSPVSQITGDLNRLNTSQPDWTSSSATCSNILFVDHNQQRRPKHRCPKTACSSTFGRKSDLERHFRMVHCGRFSYSCGVSGCDNNKGMGYSRVDKLREHQLRRHGESGRRKTSLVGMREGNSVPQ